ncbi:MAG: hypothetical protein GTO41_28150 [Burkholderiales bacterium]|nr:hypothetical protein [Burkholderiales bacterium]
MANDRPYTLLDGTKILIDEISAIAPRIRRVDGSDEHYGEVYLKSGGMVEVSETDRVVIERDFDAAHRDA